MLQQVRHKIFGCRKVDSRLDSLEMVSNQDIVNCLNLIDGFGADFCLGENKIKVIKTLRRFSKIGLKQAKDIVEVLAEACQEGPDVCRVLKAELASTFPNLQHVE